MILTQRVHPFPFRTRKLSSAVAKILVWRRTGKIAHCRHTAKAELVFLTQRVHPFPFRTRKLSSAVAKILAWRRAGKIAHCRHTVSDSSVEGPPVPIPNTEVKLYSGDNTCLETDREDSSTPTPLVGDFNAEGPPVPIPNTEVKLCCGHNTCLEMDREDSSLPTQCNPSG